MKYFFFKIFIVFFAYSLNIQGQDIDCYIYNKALVHIDSLLSSTTSQKYYFYIEENKRKITKDILKEFNFKTLQDSILKLENISFSNPDTIACMFNNLKFEVCKSDSDKPYLIDIPSSKFIDTTKYFSVGISFYQVMYQECQHALLAVIVRYNLQVTAAYCFLFERKDKVWTIKEMNIEVN